MAQQKLYTEEQVRKAMVNWSDCSMQDVIDRLTPIELPSDEEILALIGDGMHDYYKGGFEEGAKWMRDKILNK